MNSHSIRISSIKIEHLKNVRRGIINLENPRNTAKGNMLALYGQNGSGKTALIDSLAILQYILSGTPVPAEFCQDIDMVHDEAHLCFDFKIRENAKPENYFLVSYSFTITRTKAKPSAALDFNLSNKWYITVSQEVLKIARCGAFPHKKMVFADTNASSKPFIPISKYESFCGSYPDSLTKLTVAKHLAEERSLSFLFSPELLETIAENKNQDDPSSKEFHYILSRLAYFGANELHVRTTRDHALNSLGVLIIPFKTTGKSGIIRLPLDNNKLRETVIPKETLSNIKDIINKINIVLVRLIIGLTIDIKIISEPVDAGDKKGMIIQINAKKGNLEYPLQQESEGIRKIISVLQLLTAVYNQKSVTVAIDELDSGIYEFLLGELLGIISQEGSGQLIFTSHNLRPLETINRNFVAFTTTNPDDRYIRFEGLHSTNNLRDQYYRKIILGTDSDLFYHSSSSPEISFAFRKTGSDAEYDIDEEWLCDNES